MTLNVDQALAAVGAEGAETGVGLDDAIAAVGVIKTPITAVAPAILLNMPAIFILRLKLHP